jgi:hypothetical protein
VCVQLSQGEYQDSRRALPEAQIAAARGDLDATPTFFRVGPDLLERGRPMLACLWNDLGRIFTDAVLVSAFATTLPLLCSRGSEERFSIEYSP